MKKDKQKNREKKRLILVPYNGTPVKRKEKQVPFSMALELQMEKTN
jgi:hypothetical protein